MKKLILFLFLFVLITGCSSINPFDNIVSPIITGVLTWKDGEAQKYYNEETETMYHSVKSALRELNMEISKDEVTKNGYYIIAGTKEKFRIRVIKIQPHITKVGVRVNVLGDHPYAELFYKTVDDLTDTIEFDHGKPVRLRGKIFQ